MVSFLSNPVITGALGIFGGIFLTLATRLGEGLINEFYENRKQRRLKRIEAAKDINSFCVEGMHKNFRIKAGSEQHIKFRATEIEAIDENVGMKLRHFIDSWSQCRSFLKKENLSLDDEKMAREYRDKAQRLSEELLEVAREWSK